MRLILMRHATCEGLDENIINGWRDFPLTKEGRKEAKKIAKKLNKIYNGLKIDKTFSSYLSRTYDTANIIIEELKCDITVYQDIRLNERHYGFFQGMKREDAYKYPEYNTLSICAERLNNNLIPMSEEEYALQLEEYNKKTGKSIEELRYILPRSESIIEVQDRLTKFLEEQIFIKENMEKTILIVGHANTVKLTAGYVEKLKFDEVSKLRFATCGMKIYDLYYDMGNYTIKNITNINEEWIN